MKKINHGVYTCLDHGSGHRNLEFKKYHDKVFGNTDENINNLKIIVPQHEVDRFNSEFYISCPNKNVDLPYYKQQFYHKIEEVMNADISMFNDIQYIGFCNLQKALLPIKFDETSYDIILGPNCKVNNILSHFIVKDLYRRSDIKDYDMYINEFKKIFDEEQMQILLTSQWIHFGGQFIMPKQLFIEYKKYLITKLDLFTNSEILSKMIKSRKFLLAAFAQRVLELYVQKNKLRVCTQ